MTTKRKSISEHLPKIKVNTVLWALSLVSIWACHQRPLITDQNVTVPLVLDGELSSQHAEDLPNKEEVSTEAQEIDVEPIFYGPLPASTPVIPEGLSSLSAQECNSCHFETHESWNNSAHEEGWRLHQMGVLELDEPLEQLCIGCHLPIASQHSSLVAPDDGQGHAWDPTLQQEGVTCAACHVRDGTVYGVNRPDNAPHPVTQNPELQSAEFCSTCHQLSWPGTDRPIYDTYGEWSRSWYADAGLTCQTCHMQPVAGVATAGGLSYFADHSTSIDTSRAITVQLALESAVAVRGERFSGAVSITNSGAGHNFPTGSPFKSVVVTVKLLDDSDNLTTEESIYSIARVVQDQEPWNTLSDNTLSPSESVEWVFDFIPNYRAAAGAGKLVVEVAFKDSAGDVQEPFTSQSIPVTLR